MSKPEYCNDRIRLTNIFEPCTLIITLHECNYKKISYPTTSISNHLLPDPYLRCNCKKGVSNICLQILPAF